MANVLLDFENWVHHSDSDGLYWNPATHRYEDTYFLGTTAMEYIGPVADGDVVHGTFLVGYVGEVADPEENTVLVQFVDADGNILFQKYIEPNYPVELSFTAAVAELRVTSWRYSNVYPMAFISPPFTPPPPDRWVRVRVSKDGGHNWSNWRQMSLGQLGEYQDRAQVVMRRWGVARQFCFDIEVSSPIKASLLAAYADYEQLGS